MNRDRDGAPIQDDEPPAMFSCGFCGSNHSEDGPTCAEHAKWAQSMSYGRMLGLRGVREVTR